MSILWTEAAKRETYPELVASSRCWLVTLACEVGSRWSDTCVALLCALAARKAEESPALLRGSARTARACRWWALLCVARQSALAAMLTEDALGGLGGFSGEPPALADVLLAAGHPLSA